MAGLFDDLRVIDLSSGPTGGIATMVLADFGADVIKVEPPGGDPTRAEAAAPMWLRGKRSVTLDLHQPVDRQGLHRLVRGADVVVASFKPSEAAALGADYETLRTIAPAVVYCSITGWGPRGPYAEYPADPGLVAAKSGRLHSLAGITTREGPAWHATRTETHAAAQSALSGVVAALLARDHTGRGQLVETSLLQGQFPYDLGSLLRVQLSERYPELLKDDPFAVATATTMPTLGYLPIMASDGRWIQFANLLEHLFQSSIVALGLVDEVIANPRYEGAPRGLTDDVADEVRRMMLTRARERPAEEWMKIFHENGNVAAEIVTTAQEALHHPDLIANGEVLDMEHPHLGTVRQLGPLARLTKTPASPTGRVSDPGEDTTAVLAEAPRQAWTAPAAGAPSGPLRPPLDGVTVLEFATIIAAPLGASLLADFGARVIKVEPTGGGDPARTMGVGLGAYISTGKTAAGKESICIDLKSEEGQEIVGRLIEKADLVIHNYRPGVPERLGIGYERSRKLNPGIVHISVNGYGPDGPSAHRPAAHPIPGAVCGAALRQAGVGWPTTDTSTMEGLRAASRWFGRANDSHPDPNTSVVVASTALLGLYGRRRTGEGQQIFLSMLGANGYANFDDFLSYDGKRPRSTVDADLYGTTPIYRLHRAKDSWVFLGLRNDAEFAAFCSAVGRADLAADVRFATESSRASNEAALVVALEGLFQQRTAPEWEQLLIGVGVPCVESIGQSPGFFFRTHEQMRANGFNVMAKHTMWGEYQRWGPTVTFSETPGRYGPGVLAGEQTDMILREFGYSEPDVATLRDQHVVDSPTPMPLGAPVPVAT